VRKVPDTSTQRPALRPNSPHHVEHYIVHGPGDARDGSREPAVAGRPCAPPLAYDLHPAGKPPVLRALHPEQCRACRCDVGSLVGSPRRATSLDALGAHRSHTVGPVHGCTCPPVYLEATGFETSWVWPSGLEKTAKIAASPSSEVRLWSLELPPAQVLKSCPVTHASQLPYAYLHA